MPMAKATPPRNHSIEELERYKGELRREIETLKTGDKAEKDELRDRLAKAEEEIKKQREATERRDAASQTSSTMVLPPHQVQPQQTPQNHEPSSTQTIEQSGNARRRGWKGLW